jgi:hypothetical protein
MRGFIFLTIVAIGAFWAFDTYEYGGRYSHAFWQQTVAEGRYFSDQVQRLVNKAMSGS